MPRAHVDFEEQEIVVGLGRAKLCRPLGRLPISNARVVKADEEAVMTALDAELAKTERFREHPSLTGEHKGTLDHVMLRLSLVNWRVALPALVLVVILIAATVVYRQVEHAQSADPVAGLEPGRYNPPAEQTAELLPFPPAPR